MSFSEYKDVAITEIADIERVKTGKLYHDCVMIQVSATRGQLHYIKNPQVYATHFCAIMPDDSVNAKYLYYILERAIPGFLAAYQTGLNINPEIFQYLRLQIHTRKEDQLKAVAMLDKAAECIAEEEKYIADLKEFKRYHLGVMFPE